MADGVSAITKPATYVSNNNTVTFGVPAKAGGAISPSDPRVELTVKPGQTVSEAEIAAYAKSPPKTSLKEALATVTLPENQALVGVKDGVVLVDKPRPNGDSNTATLLRNGSVVTLTDRGVPAIAPASVAAQLPTAANAHNEVFDNNKQSPAYLQGGVAAYHDYSQYYDGIVDKKIDGVLSPAEQKAAAKAQVRDGLKGGVMAAIGAPVTPLPVLAGMMTEGVRGQVEGAVVPTTTIVDNGMTQAAARVDDGYKQLKLTCFKHTKDSTKQVGYFYDCTDKFRSLPRVEQAGAKIYRASLHDTARTSGHSYGLDATQAAFVWADANVRKKHSEHSEPVPHTTVEQPVPQQSLSAQLGAGEDVVNNPAATAAGITPGDGTYHVTLPPGTEEPVLGAAANDYYTRIPVTNPDGSTTILTQTNNVPLTSGAVDGNTPLPTSGQLTLANGSQVNYTIDPQQIQGGVPTQINIHLPNGNTVVGTVSLQTTPPPVANNGVNFFTDPDTNMPLAVIDADAGEGITPQVVAYNDDKVVDALKTKTTTTYTPGEVVRTTEADGFDIGSDGTDLLPIGLHGLLTAGQKDVTEEYNKFQRESFSRN